MKGFRLVEFGDPPRFERAEASDPEPKPGQVVIAMRAAALDGAGSGVATRAVQT